MNLMPQTYDGKIRYVILCLCLFILYYNDKGQHGKKTRKVVPLLLYGDFFATRLDLIHVGKKGEGFFLLLLITLLVATHTHTLTLVV